MRKALALLAAVGAFMFLAVGVASAQQYPGTTTTTTTPDTETVVPTTTTTVPVTTTSVATTTTDDGVGGAGGGAGGGGTLPATGSESLPLAQMAIVLVAAGGIALMAVRRQAPAPVNTDS